MIRGNNMSEIEWQMRAEKAETTLASVSNDLLYCHICGNDSKTTKRGVCEKCRKEIASDYRRTHFYEY